MANEVYITFAYECLYLPISPKHRLTHTTTRVKMVKVKLTISIQPELVRWIDEQIAKGYFADRSHAMQYAIMKVKELMEKGEIKF